MDLWTCERAAWADGYAVVCGCDEAGAGPLAGPVYAAAVVLPQEVDIPGLNDSKKLTAKRREALYDAVTATAVSWAVARVEAAEIDRTDILSARLRAMQMAVDLLAGRYPLSAAGTETDDDSDGKPAGDADHPPEGFARGGADLTPDLALVDGNRDRGQSAALLTPHRLIVGGDGKSASIAAASILAKVSRDRYAVETLDRLYPAYQFARHKGYGTKLHYAMLDEYGPCPAHRRTFLKKWAARRGVTL